MFSCGGTLPCTQRDILGGLIIAANREGESVTAINKEGKESREGTILRIRRGIRSAQLRVALDGVRGRETPEAVVRLAQLTPPKLPSTFVTLRTPDGRLQGDPEALRSSWPRS